MFKYYFILLLIALIYTTPALAQDQSVKDLQAGATKEIKKQNIDSGKIWKTGGLFSLNIGQGSQSNWAAGGDDFSFSLLSYLGYYAFYKKGRYSWDNTLDLNYGLINTTSLGTRKNDDRIDLLSKVGYSLTRKLNLSGLVNFHSQFSRGYNYTSATSKTLLSTFFAPAYVLTSIGVDYKPVDGLSIFVSPVTSRWIFVENDSLSAHGAYGVTPGKKNKNEIGAFASIIYIKNLSKIIAYNGRLDLFSNYEHNPQNVDLLMNNVFSAKVSKLLVATLELDMIYDNDVKLFGKNHDSPGLQLKSLIGVGLSVKL